MTRMWSAASAPSTALLVWPSIIGSLAKAAGDVVFRQLVAGVREDAIRLAHLDEIAEMEVRRALRNARGLLHRVRDDDDGVDRAQLVDEVFDLRRGDGVERRA